MKQKIQYQHFTYADYYAGDIFSGLYSVNSTEWRITCAAITTGNVVSYGFAVCSHNDQFCKKTGREIAYARAKDGDELYCVHSIGEDVNTNKAFEYFIIKSLLSAALPEKLENAIVKNMRLGIK